MVWVGIKKIVSKLSEMGMLLGKKRVTVLGWWRNKYGQVKCSWIMENFEEQNEQLRFNLLGWRRKKESHNLALGGGLGALQVTQLREWLRLFSPAVEGWPASVSLVEISLFPKAVGHGKRDCYKVLSWIELKSVHLWAYRTLLIPILCDSPLNIWRQLSCLLLGPYGSWAEEKWDE